MGGEGCFFVLPGKEKRAARTGQRRKEALSENRQKKWLEGRENVGGESGTLKIIRAGLPLRLLTRRQQRLPIIEKSRTLLQQRAEGVHTLYFILFFEPIFMLMNDASIRNNHFHFDSSSVPLSAKNTPILFHFTMKSRGEWLW